MKQPGGYRRGGLKADDLAANYGKSRRHIMRLTAEPREDYEARAQHTGRQVLQLREEGLSIRKIASLLGVSVGTVHRHIKAAQEE